MEKELDVQLFREEVERFYLEDFCYVKTDPWDDTEFLLDQYFTYLSLNEEDRGSGILKKIPLANSHNDIFNVRVHGRKPNRILVFGEGGSGKTTLCKKLAYDWAKRDPESPLKDVPVLCVLEFRKLIGSESIEDAIHNQLLCRDSQITPDQIRRFIRSNPSKVVIILDGYDEFDPKAKGDIKDLLNSEIMAKVMVLVTTRPWSSCLLQQKKRMYAQISLDGFDHQGIETYIRNYFPEEQKADACLAQIRSNGALNALASSPIVLSMVCFVMKVCSEDIDQIDTMSKMFESFLRALFIKFLDKHSFDEDASYTEASSEKEIKSKLRNFWNGLGEMALLAVGSEGKKIFFTEEEFPDNSVRVLGLQVGFLMRHKSKLSRMDALESPMTFYSFPHLLFQEKCAGDYLASHTGEFDTLVSKIENAQKAFDLQYSLAFACGKGESVEYASKIMDRMIRVKAQDESPAGRPIKKDTKGDLSQKLTQGIEDDNTSLFNLALFVNYESQAKGQLLKKICRILGYNLYNQVIDGMYCSHFLYFLDFAVHGGFNLPPCLSLTLSQSSKPIFLRDYSMSLIAVFSDVTRIGITRCPIEFQVSNCSSLEARFDDPSAAHIDDRVLGMSFPRSELMFSEQCTRKELLLSGIPHPVSFTDLTKSVSDITPKVTQIILRDLEINMPKSQSIQDHVSHTMPSLKRLSLDNIKTSVSLTDCLHLKPLCPNLSLLELYCCKVHFSCMRDVLAMKRGCVSFPQELLFSNLSGTISGSELLNLTTAYPGVRFLNVERCCLSLAFNAEDVSSTSETLPIKDVSLTDVGNTMQISDLLQLFRFYCRNLNLTYSKDCITETVGPGELQCIRHNGVCVIEKLEVVSRGDPVSMPNLLIVTTVLCPHLKRMYLEGNLVNSPALPEVITERVPSLTVMQLKSVTEGISPSGLLFLMKICQNLKTLVVVDCRLTGSCHIAEHGAEKLQSMVPREITLVLEKIGNKVSVFDLIEPMTKYGFKSFAFCLNECSVDVSQPLTTLSELQGNIGLTDGELGVSFENCVPCDSSTTIQKYMSFRCPFLRLKVDGAKRKIFFTSKFNVQKCKVSVAVLLSESDAESESENKTEPEAATVNELSFQDRSFIHFMYNHHKM